MCESIKCFKSNSNKEKKKNIKIKRGGQKIPSKNVNQVVVVVVRLFLLLFVRIEHAFFWM